MLLRTRMAQAIVTQIGPRARIVGTEALLAGPHRVAIRDPGAGRYVGVSVVIVGVVAIVITVVIAIVVVARAEAEGEGWAAEPSVTAEVAKVTTSAPIVAGPVAVVGGQALAGAHG